MRIGLFLGDFQPSIGGGYTFVREVVESTLCMVGDSPHSFTIICSPKAVDYFNLHNRSENIEIVALSAQSLGERLKSRLRRSLARFHRVWPHILDNVAKKYKIDIIWFVGCEPSIIDTPYIATVWDLQHLTHPWFPEVSSNGVWNSRNNLQETALRRAFKIITGTVVGKSELEFFYRIPESRIKILPHPTPSFALNAAGEANKLYKERFKIDKPFLLYPAQFWPHKNHINLLLAFKKLIWDYKYDFTLVLVGSDQGNQGFVKKKVEDLGLTDRVNFLGFVSVEELISLYKNAIALVYPSFSGPENLPPLEAFALGCPVVASSFPGSHEQLGNAAQFFDPHDPASMADSISKIIEEPDYTKQLIKQGLERAKGWTGVDYTSGVLTLIDELEPIRRVWQ